MRGRYGGARRGRTVNAGRVEFVPFLLPRFIQEERHAPEALNPLTTSLPFPRDLMILFENQPHLHRQQFYFKFPTSIFLISNLYLYAPEATEKQSYLSGKNLDTTSRCSLYSPQVPFNSMLLGSEVFTLNLSPRLHILLSGLQLQVGEGLLSAEIR